MSGIAALLSFGDANGAAPMLGRMLDAMPDRGGELRGQAERGAGGAGVVRHAWERDAASGTEVILLEEDGLLVAADATLYYRGDLAAKLRAAGAPARGTSVPHLIAAAYRAWGDRCACELEGEFAFAVLDTRACVLLAARDHEGKRPLHYARTAGGLVVSSTAGAVRTHPAVSHELNLAAVAEAAAALSGSPVESPWRDVMRVPAGHTLRCTRDGLLRTWRHWEPPVFRDGGGTPLDEAADELRALLTAAVRERLAVRGDTAVWMSGGWDSPSIFACARSSQGDGAQGGEVIPVSVSFPPGDPGREDELIEMIAARWGAAPRWVDSTNIPVLDGVEVRAVRRDDAFAHPFEQMTLGLARATRAEGCRVALDGNGGDQLFQLSTIFHVDLLRTGRWRSLAREWRIAGGAGVRPFVKRVVQPAMPQWAVDAVGTVRGRPLESTGFERTLPPWVSERFAREHQLVERERSHTPQRGAESFAAWEARWCLTSPIFPNALSSAAATAQAEGVELRSPFNDARVIAFAANRPRSERRGDGETKRLLRHAMRGLLPPQVLAPRAVRTGLPIGYFLRGFEARFPALFDAWLEAPLLAELGIAEPAALASAWARFRERGDRSVVPALTSALNAELWLRAALGHTSQPDAGVRRVETVTPLTHHREPATVGVATRRPDAGSVQPSIRGGM